MTRNPGLKWKVVAVALTLMAVAYVPVAHAHDAVEPYYAYFPSKKGPDFKRLVHNIFGFAIDIPSSWTFGVSGFPAAPVVLLHPEGLYTGEFCDDYETIEVGKLASGGMTLEECHRAIVQGVRTRHPELALIQAPSRTMLNGCPATCWIQTWRSEAGYAIIECMVLVYGPDGIRSLAVRTSRDDYETRLSFYNALLGSFRPFEPKYGVEP